MHPFTVLLRLIIAATVLALAACGGAPLRDDVLMDTGLPLTDNMRAYDVDRYTLRHEIHVARKSISGSAGISFVVVADMGTLELNFDGRYDIARIESAGHTLSFRQTPSKLFIDLPAVMREGEHGAVTVYYSGTPVEAANPPWDGGFTWAETPSGKPWIATSFQGEGCDIWWPCKDHPSDEPSGVDLYITVPAELTVAANGVLLEVKDEPGNRKTFHWQTNIATNLYGIALNIAPYVLIESSYQSSNGTLVSVVFYAIEDHEEKARALFEREMHKTIAFFERRFGPYPWGHEKLGIAETPHLGMEHQTINAYGNEFKRDKYGFDWLLHHEFSHEWFGNLVSSNNYADLWLHEGLGAYTQYVYTEEVMGDAVAQHRLYQTYLGIDSCQPVAPRGEWSDDQMYADGKGPSANIYTKGSWAAHSLRYLLGEERFWDAIKLLAYDTTKPDTVRAPIPPRHRTTDDFAGIASTVAGSDLGWFFEVYLRAGELPDLQSTEDGDDVILTWRTPDDLPFNMPVPVRVGGAIQRVEFTGNQARLQNVSLSDLQIDPYLQILRHLPSLPTCAEQQAEDAADPAD